MCPAMCALSSGEERETFRDGASSLLSMSRLPLNAESVYFVPPPPVVTEGCGGAAVGERVRWLINRVWPGDSIVLELCVGKPATESHSNPNMQPCAEIKSFESSSAVV